MLERKVTDFESMSESSQRRGIGRVTKLFLSSFPIFFPPTAGLPISDFASMDLKAVMLELMCNCVHRNFEGLKKRTPGKTKVFVFLWKKNKNFLINPKNMFKALHDSTSHCAPTWLSPKGTVESLCQGGAIYSLKGWTWASAQRVMAPGPGKGLVNIFLDGINMVYV